MGRGDDSVQSVKKRPAGLEGGTRLRRKPAGRFFRSGCPLRSASRVFESPTYEGDDRGQVALMQSDGETGSG